MGGDRQSDRNGNSRCNAGAGRSQGDSGSTGVEGESNGRLHGRLCCLEGFCFCLDGRHERLPRPFVNTGSAVLLEHTPQNTEVGAHRDLAHHPLTCLGSLDLEAFQRRGLQGQLECLPHCHSLLGMAGQELGDALQLPGSFRLIAHLEGRGQARLVGDDAHLLFGFVAEVHILIDILHVLELVGCHLSFREHPQMLALCRAQGVVRVVGQAQCHFRRQCIRRLHRQVDDPSGRGLGLLDCSRVLQVDLCTGRGQVGLEVLSRCCRGSWALERADHVRQGVQFLGQRLVAGHMGDQLLALEHRQIHQALETVPLRGELCHCVDVRGVSSLQLRFHFSQVSDHCLFAGRSLSTHLLGLGVHLVHSRHGLLAGQLELVQRGVIPCGEGLHRGDHRFRISQARHISRCCSRGLGVFSDLPFSSSSQGHFSRPHQGIAGSSQATTTQATDHGTFVDLLGAGRLVARLTFSKGLVPLSECF